MRGAYESIESVRLEYESKMKELKQRLKTRESFPKNEISTLCPIKIIQEVEIKQMVQAIEIKIATI